MRKILLIEDRPQRQKSLIGDDFVEELKGKEGVTLLNKITSLSELESYNVILVHRSFLLEKDMYQDIIDLSAKGDKYIVVFSGGTSQTHLINNHLLETSAVNLYNKENLVRFISKVIHTDNELQLLELIYGENWIITSLVKYQHLVWQFGDNAPEQVEEEIYDLEDMISEHYKVDDVNIEFVENKIFQVVQKL